MYLQSYLPIIAFIKENRDNKQQNNDISHWLYRKQHESFNIEQKESKISIDFDKIGKEIYKNLEESIQKEANKRQKRGICLPRMDTSRC